MDLAAVPATLASPLGRLVGYARHRDSDALARQTAELADRGVPDGARYTDLAPAAGPLPGLDAALDALGAGDWLVVTSADRLARDRAGLAEVFARIDAAGATFAPQGIPTPREVLLTAIHVAGLPDQGIRRTSRRVRR